MLWRQVNMSSAIGKAIVLISMLAIDAWFIPANPKPASNGTAAQAV
jgi:hypothetical protein